MFQFICRNTSFSSDEQQVALGPEFNLNFQSSADTRTLDVLVSAEQLSWDR